MQVHQLADAFILVACFWAACSLRAIPSFAGVFGLDDISADAFRNSYWLYFVLAATGPLIFESQGVYNDPVWASRRLTVWSLLKGCTLTAISLVLAAYAFHLPIPRGVMGVFGVVSFAFVWLKQELIRLASRSRMARSQIKRRLVLVGSDKEVARLRHDLQEQAQDSIEVVGAINLVDEPVQKLIELLHEQSVSGVLISARHAYFERVEAVIKVCELEGVEAWLEVNFFGTQIARASFDELCGHPVVVFRSAPETSWQILAKHLVDFVGALALVILLSPVLLVVALLVKFSSPGPVLFCQQRSGLNGRPFTIFKFRTMVSNAEQFKHELAAMNEMSGPVFKITNDPRITPIGKTLRKYSLDELPQLFNVLCADMSLVGPRPLPVDEVRRFHDFAHRRRLSVRPGLTCLWQIKGRNRISNFDDWVRLDLEYIDNWSLWLDISILFRTIPVVLFGTGAK